MYAISIKPPPFLRETHGILRWLTARTCPVPYCQFAPAKIVYIRFPENATFFGNFLLKYRIQNVLGECNDNSSEKVLRLFSD